MSQKVVNWSDTPYPIEVMGEKAYKLMVLKQAGFPVPDFFTVVSNGSGNIEINNDVTAEYEKLQKPLIGRSSHPMEGTNYSFSGRFQSQERIVRLTDTEEDMVNYQSPMDDEELREREDADIFELEQEWYDTRTMSLEKAYEEVLKLANPEGECYESSQVKKYIEQHGIEGFRHTDMNLLVMEQRDVEVFGMFLTANRTNPDKMIIHYQDRRTNTGQWIVYDKTTHTIENKTPEDVKPILSEFGDTATRVEEHFGKTQQVELGYSQGKTEVYQSRNFNLGDPKTAPRFSHYHTFSLDLTADGFGYFYLPILVIDSLRHIHSKYFQSYEEASREAITPYKQEVETFLRKHPEFIAVVKDAELFVGLYSHNNIRTTGKRYDELNEITSKAKAVFRGKNQNAIRHEDWDNIETGSINVWMGEGEQLGNRFIHNHIVGEVAESKARDYAGSRMRNHDYIPPNVTVVKDYSPIRTGDYIHLLANADGTFIWTD